MVPMLFMHVSDSVIRYALVSWFYSEDYPWFIWHSYVYIRIHESIISSMFLQKYNFSIQFTGLPATR